MDFLNIGIPVSPCLCDIQNKTSVCYSSELSQTVHFCLLQGRRRVWGHNGDPDLGNLLTALGPQQFLSISNYGGRANYAHHIGISPPNFEKPPAPLCWAHEA